MLPLWESRTLRCRLTTQKKEGKPMSNQRNIANKVDSNQIRRTRKLQIIFAQSPRIDPVRFIETVFVNTWESFKGVLDSGGGKMIGNLRMHKHLWGVIGYSRGQLKAQISNRTLIPVVLIGEITARDKLDNESPVHRSATTFWGAGRISFPRMKKVKSILLAPYKLKTK
eukprot:snap_masked-scaffold_22-processed-gene-2.30-mRNA-1 protein AED:1.00 eAED:1.00 QI:0/0/0/0/1/1/2/0/168